MIIKKFKEQVEAFADRIAVKKGSQFLTYRELDHYSDKVALEIIKRDQTLEKADKNCNVSLLFEHGSHMIAGIIGALKANKTFVPLDVNYPQKRLVYMLEHSESYILLTNSENHPLAETLVKQCAGNIGILLIDNMEGMNDHLPENNLELEREASAKQSAYILYTSGSTGKPKGVVQNHENVLHFITHWTQRFSVTGSDRITLLASLSHDGAIPDIFASLLNGAALYPYNIKKKPNVSDLIDWLRQEKITIWHSVPTLYRYFTDALSGKELFPHLRLLVLGGEEVRTDDITRFKTYFPASTFANIYGQTESTVNSIWLLSRQDSFKRVIIGEPIGDTEILLVDEEGDTVEEMGIGEIVIASQHVALGYWKDKENSDNVFTTHSELGRLYWTGDLGKLNADGSITIAGRKDFQVKIRGFRVETAEIETMLLKQPSIKEAVVLAKKDENSDNYLCAYMVSGAATPPAELRELLTAELPDYMIPKYFINIEKMPLTTSGKIDRNALPEPGREPQSESEYQPPTNHIEKNLIPIWQEVLGTREIGINSNFFDLGGHSLIIMTLLSKIHQVFNVELQIKDVFDYPTIETLSQLILDSGQTLFSSIKPLEKKEYYHLSSAQMRLYILNQQDSRSTAYNLPSAIKIEGPLNIDIFKETIQTLIQRHESFRTSFQMIKGEPVQVIEHNFPLDIDYFNLTGKTTEAEIVKLFIKPFNLNKVPLLRVGLIEWSREEHLLLIDMPHIISDGVSGDVLVREFVHIYAGVKPAALRVQYKDFSGWQKDFFESAALKQQEKYWYEYLNGELPRLEMPLDFVRPTRQIFEGTKFTFTIGTGMMEKLNTLAREKNVTLNIMFLSLYFLLLSKYSNQEEVIVGSLVAGRNHADLENIIGMFANFLPIKCKIEAKDTFFDFLASTGKTVLDAYANQDYPLERMIDLLNLPVDLTRNPLFDTMFIFHTEGGTTGNLEIESLKFAQYPLINPKASKLDFKIDTFWGEGGELDCHLEYNTSLFKEETIEELSRHFQVLIDEVIENPHREIADIEIFTGEEKIKLSQKRKGNIAAAPKPVRLVISATFTSEPVRDYICWWGKQFHQDIDVVFAPYNQVFQELAGDESLVSTNQGINLLLIRFEDWIRHLHLTDLEKCEKLESNFKYLVKIIKDMHQAVPYFVGIFPVAGHLSHSSTVKDYLEEMYMRWEKELKAIPNIYMIDFTRLGELYAIEEVFDDLADREGHLPFSSEFYAAMGTAIAREIRALEQPSFKVIVLDCDNTLWSGICGEDGALGVRVDPPYWELQQLMIEKYHQGFLLALCSKNNEADVWEVFEKNPGMLLKKDHLVSWKINWESKSGNINALANELNLGIDSFILLDDSPVECSEVMTHCPGVLTLQLPEDPGSIPHYLKHVWAFDKIKVTDEDRSRTQMYRADKKRRESQTQSQPLTDFLAGLQLKISMNVMKPHQVSRVSQLTLRTNQFNLSTLRRNEDEIIKLLEKPATLCWVIEVSDRFGDYGLVGVVITEEKNESLFVDTLLLSCRVLGRGVEEALLAGLRKYCNSRQLKLLEANYYPTSKNKPVLEFLQCKWIERETHREYRAFVYPFEERSESVEYADIYYQESFKPEQPQEITPPGPEDILLDHIAVAVTDLERAVSIYRTLGYTCGDITYDPLQRSNLVMCHHPYCDSIELVAAADSHSPTTRITAKNGDIPYHLCYRTKDARGFLNSLVQRDISYEVVDDLKPAVVFDQKKVMFLQVKEVGLVELLEDKNGDYTVRQKGKTGNNTIRMVVSHPEHALTFYKLLGYVPLKSINDGKRLEITLSKAGAGKIEILVPTLDAAKEREFLSQNGPHLYQLCFEIDSLEESTALAVENNYKVDYINCRNRKDSKPPIISRYQWHIKTVNAHQLAHKNHLLPLENHTALQLQGLPIYEYEVEERVPVRAPYEPPRDQRESQLVEIWQKLLRQERIGVKETFFELGGNSLKAITLLSEIHKAFNVELYLKDIFENKTIKQLSQRIANSEESIYSSMESVEKRDYYPLSSAQKRLYILWQMFPESTGYNISAAVLLEGNPDKQHLQRVFVKLSKRHESLRASFEMVREEVVQRIHHECELEIEDDQSLVNGQWSLENCQGRDEVPPPIKVEKMIRNFIRPFDLSLLPLLRVGLIALEEEKYILMVDMHHIISDGISHLNLVSDFIKIYTGEGEDLPALRLQYKDYSQWQQHLAVSGIFKQQQEYWLNQFDDEIPVLNLPTDYTRPSVQNFEGNMIRYELSPGQTRALNQMAQIENTTLFMVIMAVYNIFLSKISSQEDILVGVPIAGRKHHDLNPIIGMFVNTLVLRNYPGENKEFNTFLQEIKTKTLKAFENQDYQFEDLVERVAKTRDTGRNPLFDAALLFQNMDSLEEEIPGLEVKPYDIGRITSQFDLKLEGVEQNEQLLLKFEYSTGLFKEKTIQRFIGYFKNAISAVLENPGIKIRDIEIIPAEERNRLLVEFNDTKFLYPPNKTLHGLFEQQVEKTPDHTALVGQKAEAKKRRGEEEKRSAESFGQVNAFGEEAVPGEFPGSSIRPVSLTYRELNEKSARLAGLLIEKGVKPDTIAGIMLERSIEMIIGILGILKAGGAYLPIDPEYPQERIDFMLKDSGAKVLIATGTLVEDGETRRRWEGKKNFEILFIDTHSSTFPQASNLHNFPPSQPPNSPLLPATGHRPPATSLAYIIYTSGSTGKPKGVMVEHQSAVNYICWAIHRYIKTHRINFPLFTSFTFDLTVTSIFTPLLSGNSLVVYGGGSRESVIEEIVGDNRVGIVKLTPSHLKMILEQKEHGGNKIKSFIKRFIVGGEDLKTQLAGEITEAFHEPPMIFNEYGPTEATVGCMTYVFSPGKDVRQSVPIGIPAANVQLYILDKGKKIVPMGAPGELYISGEGLARGYLNRPQLTAERFEENPYLPGTRMYQTGDLAKFLEDGNIEFLGRIDHQVKIRGYRIEMEEIQSRLLEYKTHKPIPVVEHEPKIASLREVRRCTRCLLPANYPGIRFDNHGVCTVCLEYEKYKDKVGRYFKTREDFKQLIETIKKTKKGKYDCLLLFSGGKDSSYVLYQLMDMGLKVLTFTFDNGFISEAAFANIERITSKLGVENIIGSARNMNKVFVESLNTYHNVCQGCWNALNTVGAKLAREKEINLVISGLSRGQIFEMRLEGLFQRGIFEEKEIQENLLQFRKTFHSKNNKFSRILDVQLAEDAVEQTHFVDYFRYVDTPVPEIKAYLSEKGWVQPEDTGFCSSNCIINDVGIYVYLKEKGYHFYANQISWDCRLGSITREQGVKEIGFAGDLQQVDNILSRIGYYHSPIKNAVIMDKENERGDKHLVAYIVADEELTVQELREYLAKELPDYMVPSSFVQLEKIPLTPNGKVDRKALEVLGKRLAQGTVYVPPRSEAESKMVDIWKEVLQLEQVGIHDNYFDLGGTSFEIIRINSKLKEIFQLDIPVVTMFRYTTVQSLTQYLSNTKTEIHDRSTSLKRGKGEKMQQLQKRRGARNG